MTVALVKSQPQLHCSFCGKYDTEVEVLIAGPLPKLFICDECVETAQRVVTEKKIERAVTAATESPAPSVAKQP